MVELPGKKWTVRFNGSATTTSNSLEIMLSCKDGDTMPLSSSLGFPIQIMMLSTRHT